MATLRERSKALGVITDAIKTIENFVKNYDAEVDRDKIDSRLSRLDLLYDRFIEASIGLELLMEEKSETKATFVKSRNEMEEKYYTLHDFLTANRATRHVAANPSPVVTSVVRLPKIDLPTFDGQIDNWIPFYDAYRSLIHNNKDLAAVDKFHYLMAALKEPVKKLLDTTSVTGDNYRIAWDLLVSRFDNKRLLIKNHISSLFAIEPVRKESSAAILGLVDQFERHVKILTTLGEQTEQWSSLLVHMVCSRLNQSILREWERSTGSDKEKIPTYDELITFLKDQARILLSLNSGSLVPSPPKDKPRLSVAHTASVAKPSPSKSFSCVVCNQQHRIYDCEVFKRMPIEQKQDTVRKKKLCWNCLSSNHLSRECSSKPCRKCSEKHHTLLHASSPNDRSTQPQVKPPAGSQQSTTNIGSESMTPALLSTPTPSTTTTSITQQTLTNALAAASSSTTTFSTVLLSTAVVKVHGPSGKSTFVRTLLDSCSESNFITERIVQLLGLTRRKQAAVIAGMGGSTVNSTNTTVATFSSVDSTYSNTLSFSILPKITNDLPARPINMSQWNLPPELVLADPDFATPQRIDMVIGAQLFFSLLREGQMLVGSGPPQYQPVLQRTVLGWVVSGTVSTNTPAQDSEKVSLLCTADNLDQQLTRFWEVESCPKSRGLSKEESACELYFAETTTRDESGRFVVRLPKKHNVLSQLGDSKSGALRRFHWMQRRLDKNPELKSQYSTFMAEYIELGHMVPVDSLQDNTHPHSFYLPHHAVLKPSSTTTKCRVVFDGSSKSPTGISLNECLMVGPTVQDTLYDIVIRFCMHEVALVADVTKMYRQIWVHPDDRPLQLVYWQSSTDPHVRPYELTTVTYGTACAPYLATRCLQQLSFDNSESEDDVAARIGKDFYVDDFLSGADTVEEAMQLRSGVQGILSSAGFELRKWSSNSSEVLSHIPDNLKDDRPIIAVDDIRGSVSTLGLLWHPESDTFRFKVPECSIDSPITKRVVVSEMSKLFDPLGILGPVIITAKVFVQQLWKAKLSWDEVLPNSLCTLWNYYRRGLTALGSLSIPRLVKAPGARDDVQLHGFCDASQNAYGACIYLRSVGRSGVVTTRLLTAKSRVAPIQTLSIPRLELCSAVLLSQLYQSVMLSLNVNANAYFWSDYSITLHWLHNPPSNFNTFVANRVAEVQRLTEGGSWDHVAGLENPADLISRGIDPCELANIALWWKGPPWLTSDPAEWPRMFPVQGTSEFPPEVIEAKSCKVAAVTRSTEAPDRTLFTRYSSPTKLIRIAAYCRRFVRYCRVKMAGFDLHVIPYLTSAELLQAQEGLVKVVQNECFSHEIAILQARSEADLKKSPLRTLNPFIHDGLLLVGGRLNYSSYSFTRKHPMRLPAAHPFTSLLVESVHQQLLHASPRAMIAHIRERFWPLNLCNLERNQVKSCVRCYRIRPQPEHQLMGQLPKVRITPARPFFNTGVDFSGPVWLKASLRRTKPVPPIRAYAPGHFLVGSALQSIPEPDLAQVPKTRLSLWQEMQRRTQTCWKLWSTDYLHQLQQRSKHFYRQPNVLVGKLILLKDDNLPPLRWSVGRIETVHPGADGLVRVVTVRLASGTVYDWPIVKICLLPIDSEDSPSSTSGEVPGHPDDTAAPAANQHD